ncbi:MAG: ABC transporter ATP-binding protein [Desulfobacteraceae bacterium]
MTVDKELIIKGVSKSFRGLEALRDVSLRVAPGEIVGLIGPNGAGKTTLFNVVSGFIAPDKGIIELGEETLLGKKPHDICKLGMARTFQIVKPFGDLSVLENVAVGGFNHTIHSSRAEEKSWGILEFVGLASKALTPARTLTTPDRKRLELARALATDPKLLLLDEVMAGLNPTEKDEVIGLVKKIRASGTSVLIIEHAMRVIMGLCERIYVLDYGCMIAEGDPTAISRDQKVIEAYLGKEYAAAASK